MAAYENITIEKGMYLEKGGLTGALEKLDPSENYKGTSLEGLDAFQRQLKRFGIKVSGPDSDCVEKFYRTSNSTALFPEYISRAVHQGMDLENVIGDIVAATTHIDGMDYRSISSEPGETQLGLQVVNEGSAIPETNVTVQSNLVNLRKHGRMLVASYEALRFQRIDMFSVTLRQIGAYISRSLLNDAVNVLINGDGNSNPASTYSAAASSAIAYDDIIKLWGELTPYSLNTIIAPTEQMKMLLTMPEMKDSFAGHNFHKTGDMITPLGANLIHAPDMTAGKVIGLDKNFALELVIAADVMTEYDKLIDQQLERAAISCIAGFSKVIRGASVVMSMS